MVTTVPTQLSAVYEELAAQEEATAAELARIQEQLEAVRQVISLFGDAPTPAPAVQKTAKKVTRGAAKAKRTRKAKSAQPAAKTSKTKAATTKRKATASKPATAKSKAKPAATKAKGKKKDGRAASWQKYALPGVKKQPMPEAVRLILATQPDKDFKIVEVMGALFKENMPKSQYLKARNRISNILSGGVRSGEWHKGDRGAYRLNPSA